MGKWFFKDYSREVKRLIKEKTKKGMELACNVVVGQAKIYAPYKTGTLMAHINYRVREEGKDILGEVGILGEAASTVFYAPYTELYPWIAGKKARKPGRKMPWLRPAIAVSQPKIKKILEGALKL